MLSKTFYTTVALAVASVSVAQTTTASPANLALVQAQYEAQGFAENTNTGFGVPLDARAILEVTYSGNLVIENGQDYTADQVAQRPTFRVYPANNNTFDDDEEFTLMLADASALGTPDPEGNYRHYLANDLDENDGDNGNSSSDASFTLDDGDTITSYAGPGPLANSGQHRYAWMLFLQPDDFNEPQGLSDEGTAPGHWNVSQYVQQTGLTLVAASFFTVTASGTPSGSSVATSAVDTATLQISSAAGGAASSASPTASGNDDDNSSSSRPSGASNTGASAAPSASQAPVSSAGKVVASVAGLLSAVGVIALC